ncbi:MAG: acyltransferase, partial [Chloroflexi bacterium]|nr:acyltransferase [Chloroflexota bacterium]
MTNQAETLPFAAVGQDVMIWPYARIVAPEVISIGDSVIVDDFVLIMGGVRTVIGSFIHIAAFASLVGGGELIMEDFSGLSGGVRLYTGNDDYLGGSLTGPTVPAPYRQPVRSFVHIRKHAIIGANTVILPGVTIGEGASVGANSLINRDLEPWTVYVGSPVRAIRPRPKEKMLELEAQLRR